MADDPNPNPNSNPAPPWHAGVEAETLGFWQNKGLPLDDPKAFGAKLTGLYRDLEKHVGAPPDRIIRLPEKPDDTAGWNGVFSKLGVPAEAKEYDFSGVKRADGKDVDPALSDTLRAALFAARVPKDRGADVLKSVVKVLDDKATQDMAVQAGKLAEEKTKLAANWGDKYDYNHLKAMEGARRAGITPEAVKTMEGQLGYAAVMEHFRKIGAGTSEASFIESGGGNGAGVTTREGAMSRKQELMADKAWGARYVAGDTVAAQEMRALNALIDGETRAA